MSLHPQLLAWSKTRPLWQQDALRRLVDRPRLLRTDLEEIVELCKSEYGAVSSSTLQAQPLVAGAVEAEERRTDDVTLVRLFDLENVNALQTEQALPIAATGLTVVYGDNGAGKSGYVRVLKQSCRARGGAQAIYPNIYADNATPAKAALTYQVGVQAKTFNWTPQSECPAELREVSIFDSRSASVYVTDENDVAYLPKGLDLFPRLVMLTDTVRSKLERDIASLEAQQDRWPDFQVGTTVFEQLQNLGATSAPKNIQVLAQFTRDDTVAIQRLRLQDRQYKTDNPSAHALAKRQCAKRLRQLFKRLIAADNGLTDAKTKGLQEAQEAHSAARQAAELAKLGAFKTTPRRGIGTDSWKILWEAARTFATEISKPTGTFPPPSGSACPLCQQTVGPEAAARLVGFEQFVRDRTQQAVKVASAALQAKHSELAGVSVAAVADVTLLSELASLDKRLERTLREYLKSLTRRQDIAVTAKHADDWEKLGALAPNPRPDLKLLILRIEQEATVLEAAVNQDQRKVIERSLREYEAREHLGKVLARVGAEVERERLRAALGRCVNSANTAPITRKNSELIAQAVSKPLATEFARELAALRLTHIPIRVRPTRGEKARALHALQLGRAAARDVGTEEVLSEGEHRCIALAAFFAEVSLQESRSTLVFDDPVSSLDHGRREYVARRIASLSKTRPVLVFTHDMVFLSMLQESADTEQVEVTRRMLWRNTSLAGIVTHEWPWFGVKAKARIGELKDTSVRLKKLAATDRQLYDNQVRDFYGRLRDTWERAVEDHLFNGAIRRFGTEVKTQSLEKLYLLSESHLQTLEEGMTKSSRWLRGHDHAAALGLPIPQPDEIAADVAQLEDWIREMISLHKT